MLYSTFAKRPLYEQIETLESFHPSKDEGGDDISSLLTAASC